MKKLGQLTAMISSTALDLPEHRKAAIEACLKSGFFPIGMEHLPPRDATGVQVSLEMVDQADVYIGIYAWRYGWVPDFDNPGKISITEMEFNRAVERKAAGKLQEILVLVMDDDHPVKAKDVEAGDEAQKKLKDFKQRAMNGRVATRFDSVDKLSTKLVHALEEAKHRIKLPDEPITVPVTPEPAGRDKPIPKPPAFYAEPDYIGSHDFVGRDAQLAELSDWAKPADPTNLLLFEAIGGNGKSMLTWEWTTNHATKVRSDWAGRFWYSFYERGAIMADFCQRALAYMTGRSLEEFQKKKTAELKDELLAHLHAKPWLLILDGLERVLVAYHRIDAAEVPDEEVNIPTDKVLDRNPCDAIRDEDGDLLRALAAAKPSKILVSSRLTPRVLLNPSGQPINGARRITLPGLRPADAELLLKSCGITGDSESIQKYLTENCDNHPLVIGILAGLINDYMPDRGNFDCWSQDPQGGGQLNLAALGIIQRRNHILRAALDALPPASHQVLSTLALLSKAVDYETLKALFQSEEQQLGETIKDLERRGLLQYDGREQRYDLHPVVRGVAAGGMKAEDKERYGQTVVDYFNSQPHSPYEQAKTMEDVESGLQVVRTLLKLGHYQQAADAYREDLANALVFNLEAHVEVLSLLCPIFPAGWDKLPQDLDTDTASYLVNDAALSLSSCGEEGQAIGAHAAALRDRLVMKDWENSIIYLSNIPIMLSKQNQLAQTLRLSALTLDFAIASEDEEAIFTSRLSLFFYQSYLGRWLEAEATWNLLDPMGRKWGRNVYRQGGAEEYFARSQFWQGRLQEEHFTTATTLAEQDHNRAALRNLHWLRGAWRLEQGEFELASASFTQAVTMAREVRLVDEESETGLALAKFHLGQLTGDVARSEAQRLAQMRVPAHRYLALLWQAIAEAENVARASRPCSSAEGAAGGMPVLREGDLDQAKHHALAAYTWAWADGEPYVNRYELSKTTELLHELGVPIPVLPKYDPAKDAPFPWEADVRAAIEKLRAKKLAKEKKAAEKQAARQLANDAKKPVAGDGTPSIASPKKVAKKKPPAKRTKRKKSGDVGSDD